MSSQLPVYIQIHDQLENEVEQGIWKVRDRLPSERELAVRFNAGCMVLKQVIQNLAGEGILERKIGSGTYVAREKVQEKMSDATSSIEIMESQNRVLSSRTISYSSTSPSSSEVEKLNLSKDDTILRIECTRFVGDVPTCFEAASVPQKLIDGYSKAETTKSLYRMLEEKGGKKIGPANQTITTMLASEKIAGYLEAR